MIKITYDENSLKVEGHAGYAPLGKDIVCAAISALTTSFINSADLYDCGVQIIDNEHGLISLLFTKHSIELNILLNSYLMAVSGIANQYPEHVEVVF